MLESFEQLRQLLTFVSGASEEERAYVGRWLVHHHEQENRSLYRFGLIFNVLGLLTTPLVTIDEMRHARIIYHGVLLAICAAWVLWVKSYPKLGRAYTLFASYVYLIPFAYLLPIRMRLDPGTFDSDAMGSIFLAMASYLVLLSPYRGRTLPLIALSYLLVGVYAVRGHPAATFWLAVLAMALVGALLYCHALDNTHRRTAVAEFRARLMVAPRSVVLACFGEADELARAFLPAPRPCLCLSVDWKAEGDAPLARLEAFYAHCDRALRGALRDGNYYTDWIAGELFVVVFGERGGQVDDLADQILGVAAQIAGHSDADASVAIGIAAGEAHIGMMGPSTCRKATAIGEVAGRARRLLTASRPAGMKDAVVFGEEFRERLRDAWWLEELALVGDERPRDVGDGSLYVLAPLGPAMREAS